MKKIILLLLLPIAIFAQEDLLSEIDTASAQKSKVESAFKGMKIVNLESTKLAAKGDLYFIVAHRFGSVKDGFEGAYGLDNAVSQLKFLYGVTEWLTISAARSELAYDFSSKYLLKSQETNGFPVAIAAFTSLAFNNTLKESNYPNMKFENRIIYVAQLLVARKFNKNLSLELVPTFFHENFVIDDNQDNSQYAIGAGGRYKFAKRWSVNVDYVAHLNRSSTSQFKNPLSIGVDLETGGHVFQMHFSSSQGIHEAGFLGNSTGDWTTGEIFFGFNLLRVF
jgi:long-subunit fatty acid transport protein